MNPFNTYIDYLRDSYGAAEIFFRFLNWARNFLRKIYAQLLSAEYDTLLFKFVENLPYGVFVFFVGFFLSINLIRLTEGKGGIRVFNITTNSMAPEIKPGSLLFSVPAGKYFRGDIVSYVEKSPRTFASTGRIITHRIIEKRVNEGFYEYILKGDNNDVPDPYIVTTPDILGKVVINLPILGYVDYLTKTVPGFLIFIAVPGLILTREALRYVKEG